MTTRTAITRRQVEHDAETRAPPSRPEPGDAERIALLQLTAGSGPRQQIAEEIYRHAGRSLPG